MKYLILVLASILGVFAQNMNFCKEHQCNSFDFWFVHTKTCTYCCQDCCFTTITQAKQCTKELCQSNCPRYSNDNDKCAIYANGEQRGCDGSKEYCKAVSQGKDQFDVFKCVPKMQNAQQCQNSNQCKSEMCTEYVHQDNFCYGCIPDLKNDTINYGRERTTHCNDQSQYCGVDDFTCKIKLRDGKKCLNNNYMCKSNICDDETDLCVSCKVDSDCESSSQICNKGSCVESRDVGSKCSTNTDCASGNCTAEICRDNKADGEECYTNLECASNICDYQTCGGIIRGRTEAADKSKNNLPLYIGFGVLATLVILTLICFALKSRKQKKLQKADELSDRATFMTGINQSVANEDDLQKGYS